jgi:hypothetical protein
MAGITVPADRNVSRLTPDEFYHIRDVLESFGDLSMLADVVKQATSCDDNIVLASAADTVNYHFDSFCVIGATSDLFRSLVESYARLKRLGTPNLDLVFSLIELGLRLPQECNTVALLRQDLLRIESKSALAAPSPLSDNPSTAINEADPSFRSKLDQLLSSGGGMDESTMASIFASLTNILTGRNEDVKLSANETCRYLAYLRPFHPKHFDAMLVRWVCGLLKSSARSTVPHILPPLIGVGCVTIHAFVFLVKKLLQSERIASKIPNPARLKIDILDLLVPPAPGQNRYFDLVCLYAHSAGTLSNQRRSHIASTSRSRSSSSSTTRRHWTLSAMLSPQMQLLQGSTRSLGVRPPRSSVFSLLRSPKPWYSIVCKRLVLSTLPLLPSCRTRWINYCNLFHCMVRVPTYDWTATLLTYSKIRKSPWPRMLFVRLTTSHFHSVNSSFRCSLMLNLKRTWETELWT